MAGAMLLTIRTFELPVSPMAIAGKGHWVQEAGTQVLFRMIEFVI